MNPPDLKVSSVVLCSLVSCLVKSFYWWIGELLVGHLVTHGKVPMRTKSLVLQIQVVLLELMFLSSVVSYSPAWGSGKVWVQKYADSQAGTQTTSIGVPHWDLFSPYSHPVSSFNHILFGIWLFSHPYRRLPQLRLQVTEHWSIIPAIIASSLETRRKIVKHQEPWCVLQSPGDGKEEAQLP